MKQLWIVVCVAFSGLACSTPEDWLAELERLEPAPTSTDFVDSAVIFDAGQLGHEALSGLATADEMTYGQAMRSLSHGINYVIKAKDNALLQADAAVLVGRMVTRIPIPPVEGGLTIKDPKLVADRGSEAATILVESRAPLSLGGAVAALDADDAVAREDALDTLRAQSDQDFGTNVEAWRTWWDSVKDARRTRYLEQVREPLETIANLEFRRAGGANVMLRLLSTWVDLYNEPEIDAIARRAVSNVARQAAVLALNYSLVNSDFAQVRADVADAMESIRDPSFGATLIDRLQRERDAFAAAKIVRALRHYPRRETIKGVVGAMLGGDPLVTLNGAETLRMITHERHGEDLKAWADWWDAEGDALWP